eukprot:4951993-Pyramimonas_sp.AAC.1
MVVEWNTNAYHLRDTNKCLVRDMHLCTTRHPSRSPVPLLQGSLSPYTPVPCSVRPEHSTRTPFVGVRPTLCHMCPRGSSKLWKLSPPSRPHNNNSRPHNNSSRPHNNNNTNIHLALRPPGLPHGTLPPPAE